MSDGKAIAALKQSLLDDELVAVTGSGVSIALTDRKNQALSWRGLIENGFAYCTVKGMISKKQCDYWKNQLTSSDLDDLLSAAEFVGRKLEAPAGHLYGRWSEEVFQDVNPLENEMAKAVRALHDAGVPLCTLNYDQLLERVTGLTTINFPDTKNVARWVRKKKKTEKTEKTGVFHLHGVWDVPPTCILGIRDYETTLGNDVRDLIQRELASFRRLVFLGCGDTFADPNFSTLIKWIRDKLNTAAPLHYALVSEDEVAARNADPTWHGFVEPISYGADYAGLPRFLLKDLIGSSAREQPSLTHLTPVDCQEENTLRSTSFDLKTLITFRNASSRSVKLYWLDYDGKRIFRGRLNPGESNTEQTYLTHPFVIVDVHDRCLGIYLPEGKPSLALIHD